MCSSLHHCSHHLVQATTACLPLLFLSNSLSFSIQHELPEVPILRGPASSWAPSWVFQVQMERVNTGVLSIWASKAGTKRQKIRTQWLGIPEGKGRVDCEFLKGSDAHSGTWRNYRKCEQVIWIFLASETGQVWAFAAKEVWEQRDLVLLLNSRTQSPSDRRLTYIKWVFLFSSYFFLCNIRIYCYIYFQSSHGNGF